MARRSKKRSLKNDALRADELGTQQTDIKAPDNGRGKPTARRRLSRRKLWLFRVVSVIFFPLLVFFVAEFLLRIADYGEDRSYLISQEIEDEERLTTNPLFSSLYFPPAIAREPLPLNLPLEKEEGTYRIYLLGASAAMGDPEPAYGIGRFLEVMLESEFPGTRFEVINTATTAINSHVVLRIAEECATHDPDMFIVYLGNNEVVGPYGAGTVLSPLVFNRAVIRLSVSAKASRIGQLVSNLIGGGEDGESLRVWRGMEMFLEKQVLFEAPELQTVYDHFGGNLRDICQIARGEDIPVMLSTVAVNLRDSAPFASAQSPDLSATEKVEWTKQYESGIALQESGELEEALEVYNAASSIDNHFAELHFRIAECHDALGQIEKAREQYELAREYDTLRFRADETINQIIRDTAKEFEIPLADVEQAMAEASRGGIPGRDHFYEHVHFNFSGAYVAARSIYQKLRESLPEEIMSTSTGESGLTEAECREHLAFTPWDEYLVLADMRERFERPPFTNQLNAEGRNGLITQQIDSLDAEIASIDLARLRETYEAALQSYNDDHTHMLLRERYMTFLLDKLGEPEAAEAEARRLMAHHPYQSDGYNYVGVTLAAQGRHEEAIPLFREALEISPNWDKVRLNLANSLMASSEGDASRSGEAIRLYKELLEYSPDSEQVRRFLAKAYFEEAKGFARRGELSLTHQWLDMAIDADPNYLDARLTKGNLLVRGGQLEAAAAQFEYVLSIVPGEERALQGLARIQNAGQGD